MTEVTNIESLIIYKQDNNIDGKDNLNNLPNEKAVYAITGRINGEPANYRFVGITDDLQKVVKLHFSDKEQHSCLRDFMQSIKIKMLVYQLLPDLPVDQDELKLKEWEKKYNPECNDELNEVF